MTLPPNHVPVLIPGRGLIIWIPKERYERVWGSLEPGLAQKMTGELGEPKCECHAECGCEQ